MVRSKTHIGKGSESKTSRKEAATLSGSRPYTAVCRRIRRWVAMAMWIDEVSARTESMTGTSNRKSNQLGRPVTAVSITPQASLRLV